MTFSPPRGEKVVTYLEQRAAVGYGVGITPYSVVTADFNRDGKPDVAVANSTSNNVSVLLGNGDGIRETERVLPLRNAAALVWSGPHELLFSEMRAAPHMAIVMTDESQVQARGKTLDNRSDIWFP